jgi:Ni,Fe-hydrogenase III small subunit
MRCPKSVFIDQKEPLGRYMIIHCPPTPEELLSGFMAVIGQLIFVCHHLVFGSCDNRLHFVEYKYSEH